MAGWLGVQASDEVFLYPLNSTADFLAVGKALAEAGGDDAPSG
jgi:hypothetical protein